MIELNLDPTVVKLFLSGKNEASQKIQVTWKDIQHLIVILDCMPTNETMPKHEGKST